MKRKVFSILFALVLLLSLGLVTAVPAGANGTGPTLDSFNAYCYPAGNLMGFSNLYGVVEFVVDANSGGDNDLRYLEINLYPCGQTCESGVYKPMIQLDMAAYAPNMFAHWMQDPPPPPYPPTPTPWPEYPELDLAEAMGVDVENSYYDASEEAWHLIIDLTKLWSQEGAAIYNAAYADIGADVQVGDPVFPKCCEQDESYQMCIEVGDVEGNQYGDLSSCVDCRDIQLYGMHLLSPNEFEPICTPQGSSVQVTWNFHADCQPEEDFLVVIYDPETGEYAAVPGYFTVTDISIYDCVEHTINVPLLPLVPDGEYNVKITSTCPGLPCTKWVEEEDAVIIDSIAPGVVSVNVSDDAICESLVGAGTFDVIITFSEAMDTETNPTITFDLDVSTTLTNPSYDWSAGDTVCTVTYDVVDVDEEVSGVDVSVAGTEDQCGNPQSPDPYTEADLFNVDTVRPTLTAINWTDNGDGMICGGDVLEFVFSEPMNTTTITIGNVDTTLPPVCTECPYCEAGPWTYDATDVTWTAANKVEVTLGPDHTVGCCCTVNPSDAVKDAPCNHPDDTAGDGPHIDEEVGPTLVGVGWSDKDDNDVISEGDTLKFVFSEPINTDTLTPFDTNLPTSGGHSYGTGAAITETGCEQVIHMTVGASPTVLVDETVNPTDAVTDCCDNPDATALPPAIEELVPEYIELVFHEDGHEQEVEHSCSNYSHTFTLDASVVDYLGQLAEGDNSTKVYFEIIQDDTETAYLVFIPESGTKVGSIVTNGEASATLYVGPVHPSPVKDYTVMVRATAAGLMALDSGNEVTFILHIVAGKATRVDIEGPDSGPVCQDVEFTLRLEDDHGNLITDEDANVVLNIFDPNDNGSVTWVPTTITETAINLKDTGGEFTFTIHDSEAEDDVYINAQTNKGGPSGDTHTIDFFPSIVDVPGPPVILDAVTGWGWSWMGEHGHGPYNLNDRTSIMVVFSEALDPETVDKTDFRVTGKVISSIEYHTVYHPHPHEWVDPEYGSLSTNIFGLVFLTVSPLMATDTTPTVNLVGAVSDFDEPPFESVPDSVVAQDGIAPVITLSSNPLEPVYNQMVTITATATEKLSEANCGLPKEGEGFDEYAMTPDATGKVWTYEFLWRYPPMYKLHIKVWAHDFTAPVVCKWWKHAKWTEESLIFGGEDYIHIHLYEGWNLISVPGNLVNPSLNDVFHDGSVTKVYNWTGYGWQHAMFNPIYGTWSGVLRTIEPGKGYWVWCSPNEYHLGLYLALPDPMDPPPAYSLVKGWNLVGFTALDYPLGHGHRCMNEYLFSLCDQCKLVYWYAAHHQQWFRVAPMPWWWDSSCSEDEFAIPGYGYWLYLSVAGTLAP